MGGSLKEALEKAGLKASDSDNERKRKPRQGRPPKEIRPSTEIVKHQQPHYFCDCCKKTAPDVEFYQHNNKSIQGSKWLCIKCADEKLIPDELRQSNQSDCAMRGTFRRNYGKTIKSPKTSNGQ